MRLWRESSHPVSIRHLDVLIIPSRFWDAPNNALHQFRFENYRIYVALFFLGILDFPRILPKCHWNSEFQSEIIHFQTFLASPSSSNHIFFCRDHQLLEVWSGGSWNFTIYRIKHLQTQKLGDKKNWVPGWGELLKLHHFFLYKSPPLAATEWR